MKRKSTEEATDVVSPPGSSASSVKRPRADAALRFDASDIQTLSPIDEGETSSTLTTQKRRGRPRKNAVAATVEPIETPTKRKSNGQHVQFSTPDKKAAHEDEFDQAPLLRGAEQSARRKSARRILERAAEGRGSEHEDSGEEEDLARRIWDEDNDGESEDELGNVAEERDDGLEESGTPSKTGRGRGRPKGRRKQPTPSPPRDLPPYEHYFFQNRPGGAKTSSNTLTSLSLLSHETYFDKISAHVNPHEPELSFLQQLHSRAFDRWGFELEQRFNLCLYGWGSKRALLGAFAAHLNEMDPASKIIIVNGYNPGITSRDVLTTIASAVPSLAFSGQKLGSQPLDMLNTILAALASKPPRTPLTLLINSIDSHSLRRPATQAIVASLAASPHIRLVATADTPNFPLMWDTTLCAQFRWLYHDVTTFQPFDVELASKAGGGGVVDEVNALLGRSGRKMQGREGVMYVLKSLTENARNLFSLLIAELLAADDEDGNGGEGAEGQEEEEDLALTTPKKGRSYGTTNHTKAGIDFRTLYQKAASQFIATNETTFRGLLREFYDHEMIVSRKDGLGGEVFGVPFRREEMEAILEELTINGDT